MFRGQIGVLEFFFFLSKSSVGIYLMKTSYLLSQQFSSFSQLFSSLNLSISFPFYITHIFSLFHIFLISFKISHGIDLFTITL